MDKAGSFSAFGRVRRASWWNCSPRTIHAALVPLGPCIPNALDRKRLQCSWHFDAESGPVFPAIASLMEW